MFHLHKIHIYEKVVRIGQQWLPLNPRWLTGRRAPFSLYATYGLFVIVDMVVEEVEGEGREVEKDVDRHLQLSASGQKNLRAQVPCSGLTGVENVHINIPSLSQRG